MKKARLPLALISVPSIKQGQNLLVTNQPAVDTLGVTQRLYGNLDNEIDTKLRQNGYLPTLNVLLTYRLNQ